MKRDPEMPIDSEGRTESAHAAPSADFIHAISEFLDTDPNDLLVELGYYEREGYDVSDHALADVTSPQE